MFKLPQSIHCLAFAIIGLSLTALDPASAAQEPGNIEEVKQFICKEFALNANATAADYLWLGITHLELNELREAEAAFCKAIKLDPNDVDAHINLGLVLARQGKREEAITAYRQALRLDPKSGAAQTHLRALANQDKLHSAATHTNLGVALARQGKLQKAIAEFEQAIYLDPKSAVARKYLRKALARQGKLQKAIAKYEEAIRLNPKSAVAQINLGSALARQGKREEAIAAYQKARDLYKAQGKTQTANRVEQIMRRIGTR